MLFSEKIILKIKVVVEKKNFRKNRRAIKNKQSYDTFNIGHRRQTKHKRLAKWIPPKAVPSAIYLNVTMVRQ
jgi:hypothetical protein